MYLYCWHQAVLRPRQLKAASGWEAISCCISRMVHQGTALLVNLDSSSACMRCVQVLSTRQANSRPADDLSKCWTPLQCGRRYRLTELCS